MTKGQPCRRWEQWEDDLVRNCLDNQKVADKTGRSRKAVSHRRRILAGYVPLPKGETGESTAESEKQSLRLKPWEKKCPCCGKAFILTSADDWVYKSHATGRLRYLCSWTCLQKWRAPT